MLGSLVSEVLYRKLMRIMRTDALLTSDLVIIIWMTDVGLKKETGGKTMEPGETVINSRVRRLQCGRPAAISPYCALKTAVHRRSEPPALHCQVQHMHTQTPHAFQNQVLP